MFLRTHSFYNFRMVLNSLVLFFVLLRCFALILWSWRYGELRLCRFADAVRTEVNAPTDEATNQDIAKCPSVDGLPHHDVVELVVFRRYLNALPVYMVALRFYHDRKGDIDVSRILCLDSHWLWHVR